MKKILIFSLAYYPKHVGGAEIAIKEITERFSPEEVEFHMVTLRFDEKLPKEELLGAVRVHRIGFVRPCPTMADLKRFPLHYNKYLYQLWAFWKAHMLHREHHFTGIWAMMAHSCGVPAVLFSLLHPRIAYVQTLQEGDPPEYIEKLARPVWPLFRRAFTRPTVIQCISHFLAQWARRMGATCPVVVVPNGVALEYFSRPRDEAKILEIKKHFGKREGDIFLITTSRLVYKNGIDDVITALVTLPKTVHFLVLGIGPEENAYRRLAEEKGVKERVHFMGQVDHKDMLSYLHACDIFIRPSRSEGMGNSFVEAMATGLPVVGTQEGGIADFLFDAQRNPNKPTTGWAVDKDSPEQIARVIKSIISDPKKVAEVCKHAKMLVHERYGWDTVVRAMRTEVFSYVPDA
jgi:glycosyltransferase involved in cell wall biosynthesis